MRDDTRLTMDGYPQRGRNQVRAAAITDHCWCCHRRLTGHPSLCHCGQPHYCEGRPANWCE